MSDYPEMRAVNRPPRKPAPKHGALINFIARCKTGELSQAAQLVGLQLMAYRNPATGICWPGRRRIAKNAHMGQSTVRRAIAELEAKGVLVVGENMANNRESYTYELPDSPLPMATASIQMHPLIHMDAPLHPNRITSTASISTSIGITVPAAPTEANAAEDQPY